VQPLCKAGELQCSRGDKDAGERQGQALHNGAYYRTWRWTAGNF
jgi:hypothetical protein